MNIEILMKRRGVVFSLLITRRISDSGSRGIVPSINLSKTPFQDYNDKESANTNTCQDCNKEFSSTEELTVQVLLYTRIVLVNS
jgi:hypothetical protein